MWYRLPHLLYKAIAKIASFPFFSASFFFMIFILASSQETHKGVWATTEKEQREEKNCITDFCEWTFSGLRKREKVFESLNMAKKRQLKTCITCKILGILADLQLSQFPKREKCFMTISHESCPWRCDSCESKENQPAENTKIISGKLTFLWNDYSFHDLTRINDPIHQKHKLEANCWRLIAKNIENGLLPLF